MSQQPNPSLNAFLAGLVDIPARLEKITSYAPRIAAAIFDAMRARDPEGIIAGADHWKSDLHETDGYLLSPNKFVEVVDRNGNRYRVTVEPIYDYNRKPLTSRERQLIRDGLSRLNDPAVQGLIDRFREHR